MKRLILMFFLLALWGCKTAPPLVVDVSEFGIVPGTAENTTGKLNRLIDSLASGKPLILRFQPGRYDFFPDSAWLREYFETNTYDVNPKRLGVLIDRKRNVTIDGQGADFIFHGHMQPFTLDHSENIAIRNLNIDWDKPMTAEAQILASGPDEILLGIDTIQFPYDVRDNQVWFLCEGEEDRWRVSGGSWLIEYDQAHVIPAQTGDLGSVRGDLDRVVYRKTPQGLSLRGTFTKYPPVGNYWILRHSTRDHAGIFVYHAKNTLLHSVNVFHTSGLGILCQYAENTELVNVNMVPNPAKNRFLSGHDDGFHFMGCRGFIRVDSCRFQGLMDDPINIHGTCAPVYEVVDEYTLKAGFAHDMSTGLNWAVPGDQIGLIERGNMVTRYRATVDEFTPFHRDSFLMRFSEKLPAGVGENFTLENLTWTPSATITNCFVGSCRARGFLVSTPGEVLIEKNEFETSGSAILIAGDANYWFESGAVTDVLIRDNRFKAPCNSSPYQFCEAVISIYPEIPEPDTNLPFHRNIRIENNRFELADYPLLWALSTDSLSFVGNTVVRSHLFEPWRPNRQTFTIDACKNVVIGANVFDDEVLGRNVLLKRMSESWADIQDGLTVTVE